MKPRGLPCGLTLSLCVHLAALAATNQWTKPTSGYWEEPFWSLGQLPGPGQDVAIENPGWKAVAIGQNTTANFANSLTVRQLTVAAPADSANQLLLNYPGLTVPLTVSNDFTFGTNSSLAGYYASVRAGSMYISGPAALTDGILDVATNVILGLAAPAELNLTNTSFNAGLLLLSLQQTSAVNEVGGASQFSNVVMFAGSSYALDGGAILANSLDLQSTGDYPLIYGWQVRSGLASFTQSGGTAEFQVARMGQTSRIITDATGAYTLADGQFRCSSLQMQNATFTQTGGTNTSTSMAIPALDYSRAEYHLNGGTLLSSNITLGAVLSPSVPPGPGIFVQSGGVHMNTGMQLYGEIRRAAVTHFGSYTLTSGTLICSSNLVYGGTVTQNGGSNQTTELVLDGAGVYILTGGDLNTSNTTVQTIACVQGLFKQIGGNHRIQDRMLLRDFVVYDLEAGTLAAPLMEVGQGAQLWLQGGAVSNGLLTLREGLLRAGGQMLQMGKLQVLSELPQFCDALTQPTNATIDLGGLAGPSLLAFQDSHDIFWSGPLTILNWCPTNGPGPDHIFFGANSQGLTATQVSQISFKNPPGFPQGSYPARILSTGEVVPAVLPPVGFSRTPGGLILSWPAGTILLTATNVTGPYSPVAGVTSPYTNLFNEPQRWFRLVAP